MSSALVTVRSKYPYLGGVIDNLANFAALKQTHELTGEIIKFLDAAAQSGMTGREMIEFFNGFVKAHASKMSPLNLAKVLGRCCLGNDVDVETALGLVAGNESQLSKSKDAHILCKVLLAEIHMKKGKNLGDARTVIDGVAEILADPIYSHSVSGSVRGSYHLAASELYLSLGNDVEFYHNIVKFLTYTPVTEISAEILSRTTKQAAVIALIHPEINDFGELLSLPAFISAGGWTVDFLQAIHRGDFNGFEEALRTHSYHLQSHEQELMSKIDTSLRRKLTMIALAELAGFIAPEKNRRLSFLQISQHCRVPISDVEELVMTTMGTGRLIDGVIDEVDSTVVITSVKPRILDKDRILILKSRIESWANRTESLVASMKDLTPELLIS